jgi:septal ring factor EnvC (AmiA/AmiB activator)
VRFFERSRDLWKAKYKELQQQIKAFRTEMRDLRRSRDRWRAKAEALERKIQELSTNLEQHVGQSPPAPSP